MDRGEQVPKAAHAASIFFVFGWQFHLNGTLNQTVRQKSTQEQGSTRRKFKQSCSAVVIGSLVDLAQQGFRQLKDSMRLGLNSSTRNMVGGDIVVGDDNLRHGTVSNSIVVQNDSRVKPKVLFVLVTAFMKVNRINRHGECLVCCDTLSTVRESFVETCGVALRRNSTQMRRSRVRLNWTNNANTNLEGERSSLGGSIENRADFFHATDPSAAFAVRKVVRAHCNNSHTLHGIAKGVDSIAVKPSHKKRHGGVVQRNRSLVVVANTRGEAFVVQTTTSRRSGDDSSSVLERL